MILLTTKYQIISIDKDRSMMTLRYTEYTNVMSDEDFKEDLIQYTLLLQEYLPYRILFDMSVFRFQISNTIQRWIDENISSIEKEITKVQAFVIDKDALEQNASVQEVLNLSNNQQMLTKFFGTIEEAEAWLMLFDRNQSN